MTLDEARELYQQIPTMTVRELRAAGKKHFGAEWTSSASKRTIQSGLSQRVAREIVKLGGA